MEPESHPENEIPAELAPLEPITEPPPFLEPLKAVSGAAVCIGAGVAALLALAAPCSTCGAPRTLRLRWERRRVAAEQALLTTADQEQRDAKTQAAE